MQVDIANYIGGGAGASRQAVAISTTSGSPPPVRCTLRVPDSDETEACGAPWMLPEAGLSRVERAPLCRAGKGVASHRRADSQRSSTNWRRAEAIDNGKPVALGALARHPRAAQNFEVLRRRGDSVVHRSATRRVHSSTTRSVVRSAWWLASHRGTCRCIFLSWKAAPALAAGNCVAWRNPPRSRR